MMTRARTRHLPRALAPPVHRVTVCRGERTPNATDIQGVPQPRPVPVLAPLPSPALRCRVGVVPFARFGNRGRLARRDECGSASIQMMILMPLMFLVMFTGMQAALYYHARTIAIAAAQEGAREAGSEHGSRTSGEAAAWDFINQAGGPDALTGSSVSGSRSDTTATVTVTGRSLSVIPGWKITITQSSSVPVERLTQ